MNRCISLLTLACLVLATSAHAIGVEDAFAPDPGSKPLALHIWYPDSLGTDNANSMRLPLIVISHGTGGSNMSHEDTARALAESGFVVAAIMHTGDNYQDSSDVRLDQPTRPRHVTRTIDYMTTHWRAHQQIDAARIGMFGFSAGGFTALVIAGGVPSFSGTAQRCQRRPDLWDCVYLRKHNFLPRPERTRQIVNWRGDARVRAAVIAAPAAAYSFEPDGLSQVHIPLQLWGAGQDKIVESNAAMVRNLLPIKPEYHWVAGAGHFAFMAPCNWRLRSIITVMSWFGTERICSDPDNFNRELFHQSFNTEVVRFLSQQLH
jgi:predicted dienelactone hydrolase